ncbi:hypothetical protein PI124_g18873 [Phytophthora idaei]|nr:hypothetical protein PI125_g19779 [Phytophthora idaei]KAG3135519.1 hypothetical protein PI126_g18220 [Phytophthora idaei]KAG3236112.1 hypothetical protein PI124_g18873 [Phytophthora idaei]
MLIDLRTFLLKVSTEGVIATADGVRELVYWIDERMEDFRSHLASAAVVAATQLSITFSMSDPSFVKVLQAITRKQLDTGIALTGSHKAKSRQSA